MQGPHRRLTRKQHRAVWPVLFPNAKEQAMYRFVPNPDFPVLPRQARAELYTAVECLRIVADLMRQAHDSFDEDLCDGDNDTGINMDMEGFDLLEVRGVCELHASIWQEVVGGVLPSVPDRVFATIRHWENRCAWTQPRCEAGKIGLRLALRSVRLVRHSLSQTDEFWRLLLTTEQAVNVADCVLDVPTRFTESDEDVEAGDFLDRLVAGKPFPTVAESRRMQISELRDLLARGDEDPDVFKYVTRAHLQRRLAQIEASMGASTVGMAIAR